MWSGFAHLSHEELATRFKIVIGSQNISGHIDPLPYFAALVYKGKFNINAVGGEKRVRVVEERMRLVDERMRGVEERARGVEGRARGDDERARDELAQPDMCLRGMFGRNIEEAVNKLFDASMAWLTLASYVGNIEIGRLVEVDDCE